MIFISGVFASGTGVFSVDWFPICIVLAPRPQTPQFAWHEKVEDNVRSFTSEYRDENKGKWTSILGTATAEQFCL